MFFDMTPASIKGTLHDQHVYFDLLLSRVDILSTLHTDSGKNGVLEKCVYTEKLKPTKNVLLTGCYNFFIPDKRKSTTRLVGITTIRLMLRAERILEMLIPLGQTPFAHLSINLNIKTYTIRVVGTVIRLPKDRGSTLDKDKKYFFFLKKCKNLL